MKVLEGRGNRLAILLAIVLVLGFGAVAFGQYSKATADDRLLPAEKVLGTRYANLDLQQFSTAYEDAIVNNKLDTVRFPSAPHAQWVSGNDINAAGFDMLYEIDSPGRTSCLVVMTEANPGHKNTVTFSTSGHTSNSGQGCH